MTIRRFTILPLLMLAVLASCSHTEGSAGHDDGREEPTPLIETGELAAVNSKAFVMQRLGRRWYDARIMRLIDHGEAVHEGDTVIWLDPSNITKYITDRENDLESQRATLEKMLVNQSNNDSEKESKIRSEEATYELRKLSMQSARFESERQQRIRELEFRQATINLQRAKRNLELAEIINENDLKIQQVRVKLIEEDIKRSYELLPQLAMCSPISGIFQIEKKNRWSPELLKEGDEVDAGTTIARVPDLTWMQVNTSVHENDFLRVHVGQKVTVRLDALPDVDFPGEITSIGRLCHPKDWDNPKVKVFDVTVRLLVSDERLRPGMTVSCEYLFDKNS